MIGIKKIDKVMLKKLFKLSEREIEVLSLIVLNVKYSDIGNRLYVTRETIKKHVENMFRKIGVRDKMGCVMKLVSMGVLEYGDNNQHIE